jgi:nicotinate-nucleotide adenylyltransferase
MSNPIVDNKRTLCFGGSFNPVHHGHLITARAVAEAAGYSKVLLIPSSQPPHKTANADIAPADHRLAMCNVAVADDPLFAVSDIELRRTGPSYTIDTIRQLKQDGWTTVHWLIGADMLQILPKWRQPLDLLAEAHFIIMARPGSSLDWSTLPKEFRHLQQHVVSTPLLQISATDIRRRVRSDLPISYLVPDAVRDYIYHHHLYTT